MNFINKISPVFASTVIVLLGAATGHPLVVSLAWLAALVIMLTAVIYQHIGRVPKIRAEMREWNKLADIESENSKVAAIKESDHV